MAFYYQSNNQGKLLFVKPGKLYDKSAEVITLPQQVCLTICHDVVSSPPRNFQQLSGKVSETYKQRRQLCEELLIL